MQRYIIRKAIDSKCSFINHCVQLHQKYSDPADINKEAINSLQNAIRLKANENRSRYQSYLEINPSLKRPQMYNWYVPSHKLCQVTRIRLISHSLQIELGRQKKNPTPKDERLCNCGQLEDEKHFILTCSNYSHIRNKYPNLQNLTLAEQVDNIQTADFIYELINCRKLYIN